MNIKRVKNHQDFIEKFFIKFPEKKDKIEFLSEYITAKTKITCHCLIDDNIWMARPDNLLHGKGCPKCANHSNDKNGVKSHESFLKEYYELFPDSSIKFLSKYIGRKKKITCVCSIHNHVFDTTPESLFHGTKCPICTKENIVNINNKKYNTQWFINKYYNQFPNSRVKIIGEYINMHSKILCECLIDGYTWYTTPISLIHGHGCPKCAKNQKRTKEELLEDFNNIYKGEYIVIESSLNNYKNCHSVIQIQNVKTGFVFESTPELVLENNITLDIMQKYGNGTILNLNGIICYRLFKWINDSKEFYHNKCIISGDSNNIIVHHIWKNFSDIRDEVYKEESISDNTKLTEDELKCIITKIIERHYSIGYGIPLTKTLHNEFHSKYGKINNTYEQFIEFANSKGINLEIQKTEEGVLYLIKKETI